jgi:hypothetical protein
VTKSAEGKGSLRFPASEPARRARGNLDCDTSHDYYRDFTHRMAGVVPAAAAAYKQLMVAPLPFDVADERVADEYRSLKRQQAATSA